MLSTAHKTVLFKALAELEQKIEKANTQEAEIVAQLNAKKNAFDELERFRLTIRRAHVESKREAAKLTRVKLKSHMAPIRSLPVELLTEVFKIAVAREEEEMKNIHGQPLLLDWHWNEYNENRLVPQGLTVQEKVSHVCQLWRQVSLATPTLWQRITIALYAIGENGSIIQLDHTILSRMVEWTKRTKHAPLDITIFYWRTPLLDVWKLFEPMAARVRSLKIYDQPHTTIQEFVNSLPPMPLLETVHLGVSKVGAAPKTTLRNLHLWKVPALKELYVERLGISWNHAPIANLTKLVILSRHTTVTVPYATFNAVLALIAPQLETFVYQDHEKPASLDGMATIEGVVFPRLDTLEINVLDIRYIAHWLRYFSFPALRRVYLDIQTQNGFEFETLLAAAMAEHQGPDTDKKEAKQRQHKQQQPQRICFQRCEELTMGPCGNAHHKLGQFVITAFPYIRKFVSHPEDSRFPLSELLELFQYHCPLLTEIAAHSCPFNLIRKLILARSQHRELEPLSSVVFESVLMWKESDVQKIRELVDLVIEDGQEGLALVP